VPDPIFGEAITDGRINPDMTRSQAEQLVPRLKPQPRSETVFVHMERRPPDETAPRQVFVHVDPLPPDETATRQVWVRTEPEPRPDQTLPAEPEHRREHAVANVLAELASLIDACDIEALAALMRDDPKQIVLRVARFVERLELAVGDSALH
jgi:hypothetical protein